MAVAYHLLLLLVLGVLVVVLMGAWVLRAVQNVREPAVVGAVQVVALPYMVPVAAGLSSSVI